MGGFNVEQEEDLSDFPNIYEKKKKQKTYNKGPENSSCVNLVLRNYYRSFQNTDVIKT